MPRLRSVLIGLPPLVVLVLVCLLGLPFCATCGGHDEAVTAVLRQCRRATELLGDDAHPARMGVACGSTKVSGNSGNASWNLAYTGSRGRGDVSFDAIKRGGDWHVEHATLEVGDETIDLIACAGARHAPPGSGGGRLSQTNADPTQATFSGNVLRSTHPTLAIGMACTGNLERERGSPTAHVRVTCGPRDAAEAALAYDGRGAFTLDVHDTSRPEDDRLEYDDSEARTGDGATRCRLSASDGKGTLTVWSTAPAWELVVEL